MRGGVRKMKYVDVCKVVGLLSAVVGCGLVATAVAGSYTSHEISQTKKSYTEFQTLFEADRREIRFTPRMTFGKSGTVDFQEEVERRAGGNQNCVYKTRRFGVILTKERCEIVEAAKKASYAFRELWTQQHRDEKCVKRIQAAEIVLWDITKGLKYVDVVELRLLYMTPFASPDDFVDAAVDVVAATFQLLVRAEGNAPKGTTEWKDYRSLKDAYLSVLEEARKFQKLGREANVDVVAIRNAARRGATVATTAFRFLVEEAEDAADRVFLCIED